MEATYAAMETGSGDTTPVSLEPYGYLGSSARADLAQIFANDDAASFAALWLFIHRSRFGSTGTPATDCALERWRDAGAREGEAARSLSLEGHYGRIEGVDEVSVAALGLQYDLARGLSANLGLNHAEANVTLGDVSFVDTRETRAVFSLRYSF